MSNLLRLNSSDFIKGLRMAIFTGAFMPIWAVINTPNFSFTAINWHSILNLAVNGAIVGFTSYIAKNYFSDDQGRVFGKI